MQQGRNRKLKALTAALAVAALGAPVTQAAVSVDAHHQALLDRGTQAQVDPRHQALLRHHAGAPTVYVTSVPAPVSDGTDWTSIGLGAGAGLGVLVLGSGAALVGRRKLASA
jgi:hypothetical protein